MLLTAWLENTGTNVIIITKINKSPTVYFNMISTLFQDYTTWHHYIQPFPSLATVPCLLSPQRHKERGHDISMLQPGSEVTSTQVPVSLRLPKPFNCAVSQTSWQALCSRKTRCLELGAVVIVGSSSSKPNTVIRHQNPYTTSHLWRICDRTSVGYLTWLRWQEACGASSKLAPFEWSPVKDV